MHIVVRHSMLCTGQHPTCLKRRFSTFSQRTSACTLDYMMLVRDLLMSPVKSLPVLISTDFIPSSLAVSMLQQVWNNEAQNNA